MDHKIVNLHPDHFSKLKEFTDKYIGKDYYSLSDLLEVYNKSLLNNQNASFLLFINNSLMGMRLSYMPGKWSKMKGDGGLTPNLWSGLGVSDLGYFQSLFIHPDLTGQGWGPILSTHSLDQIKKAGAKGVLTHSWVESPNNSSRQYLSKLGFSEVKVHPLYWSKIDYDCSGCNQKPCVCTACEMLKDLR